MNAPVIPIDPDLQARLEARRKEAIAKLGERYLLHPVNRQVRKTPPQRVLA